MCSPILLLNYAVCLVACSLLISCQPLKNPTKGNSHLASGTLHCTRTDTGVTWTNYFPDRGFRATLQEYGTRLYLVESFNYAYGGFYYYTGYAISRGAQDHYCFADRSCFKRIALNYDETTDPDDIHLEVISGGRSNRIDCSIY